MKRTSSDRKTKSAVPGAKRPHRRRAAIAKPPSASTKRKRKPAAETVMPAKPATRTKRQPVTQRKPVAKRKARRSLTPPKQTASSNRRTAVKASSGRRRRVKIPAYLLEGDVPAATTVAGPGEKFALGPESPAVHFAAEAAHLPEAYGTGRLHVTARDPHWLYAHWDIAPREQFRHNARSVDRHLILRIREDGGDKPPVAEIHVHPESRHWFAHVERAETVYVTELGYYQSGRQWKSLALSAPTKTPADRISTDATVEFATIPLEVPFETMLRQLQEGAPEKLSLARAMDQVRVRRTTLPIPPTALPAWTPGQEQALADFLTRYQATASAPSSHEVSELGGEAVGGDLASLPTAELEGSSFFGGADLSSPFGGEPSAGKEFWLHVNAELIIYGATQPDAKVTLAGKKIALRPDGSFGFRYALPDGQYTLPIVAVSADDTDGRAAELKFTRTTESVGPVGATPPDPALLPPPQNG